MTYPELAADPKNSARIAVHYWNSKKIDGKSLSELADMDTEDSFK